MNRTITVKGVGSVSAKPDYITLSLGIESKEKDYESSMQKAAERIELLEKAVLPLGFEKGCLKTTNFNVSTAYDSYRDKNGNYQRVFAGYVSNYRMKLSFDFDSKRLSQVLSAISSGGADPDLNVAFTVKDPTRISEELLTSAAENAKQKAEVLCKAAGATLGQLVTIDYNWGELNIISNTGYEMDEEIMPLMAKCAAPEIEPDDINVHDTATFVWEIA